MLDRSGSMANNIGIGSQSKLKFAKEALLELVQILRPNDRFALAVFNTKGTVYQTFEFMQNIDRIKLKKMIEEIHSAGGTTLEAGLGCGIKQYTGAMIAERNRGKRIYFLRDMDDMTSNELGDLISEGVKYVHIDHWDWNII